MKNTILSQKDAEIIEKIILKFGKIAATKEILKVFTEKYSRQSAHNRIQKLCRDGWFLRVKKGLYLIVGDLVSRSSNDTSLLLVAQVLNKNSYISLDAALNYHGMFDQHVKSISAVNLKISRTYEFQGNRIRFIKTAAKYYFGFAPARIEGKLVNIAVKEKALLDYLHLDSSFYSASLVFEKLREHEKEIDSRRLENYALKFGISIQRKIGFLLDELGVDASRLMSAVKNKGGYSRFTRESEKFNAKWRVYYDDRIIK